MRIRCRVALLLMLSLAACLPVKTSTLAPSATDQRPIGPLDYDTLPGTVVISADYQPGVAGLVYQMTCLYETIPMLRVWGDGLVFLDTTGNGGGAQAVWTGRLSAAQMQAALTFLSGQGYLDGWTPGPADGGNPAAIFIDLGVHLKDRSIAGGSGNLGWPLYAGLVKQLLPELGPLSVGPGTDPRIASLNIGSQVCTTPTLPVTPNYGPTLSVLETQQPPSRAELFIGICECAPSGRVPPGFLVRNSWQRQLGSDWVLVEAGTLIETPSEGVLEVTHSVTGKWIFYETSVADGAVRIVAEQNSRLTLQAVQGSLFYFDVPSLSFANSLTQFIPTQPLPTPYPAQGTPTPVPPTPYP